MAESSAGGLVSAALLAVPGASAYFTGGLVVYTQATRALLIDPDDPAMAGIWPSTETYATSLSRWLPSRCRAPWPPHQRCCSRWASCSLPYRRPSAHCCRASRRVICAAGDERLHTSPGRGGLATRGCGTRLRRCCRRGRGRRRRSSWRGTRARGEAHVGLRRRG
jgi:hypothetical protein